MPHFRVICTFQWFYKHLGSPHSSLCSWPCEVEYPAHRRFPINIYGIDIWGHLWVQYLVIYRTGILACRGPSRKFLLNKHPPSDSSHFFFSGYTCTSLWHISSCKQLRGKGEISAGKNICLLYSTGCTVSSYKVFNSTDNLFRGGQLPAISSIFILQDTVISTCG